MSFKERPDREKRDTRKSDNRSETDPLQDRAIREQEEWERSAHYSTWKHQPADSTTTERGARTREGKDTWKDHHSETLHREVEEDTPARFSVPTQISSLDELMQKEKDGELTDDALRTRINDDRSLIRQVPTSSQSTRESQTSAENAENTENTENSGKGLGEDDDHFAIDGIPVTRDERQELQKLAQQLQDTTGDQPAIATEIMVFEGHSSTSSTSRSAQSDTLENFRKIVDGLEKQGVAGYKPESGIRWTQKIREENRVLGKRLQEEKQAEISGREIPSPRYLQSRSPYPRQLHPTGEGENSQESSTSNQPEGTSSSEPANHALVQSPEDGSEETQSPSSPNDQPPQSEKPWILGGGAENPKARQRKPQKKRYRLEQHYWQIPSSIQSPVASPVSSPVESPVENFVDGFDYTAPTVVEEWQEVHRKKNMIKVEMDYQLWHDLTGGGRYNLVGHRRSHTRDNQQQTSQARGGSEPHLVDSDNIDRAQENSLASATQVLRDFQPSEEDDGSEESFNDHREGIAWNETTGTSSFYVLAAEILRRPWLVPVDLSPALERKVRQLTHWYLTERYSHQHNYPLQEIEETGAQLLVHSSSGGNTTGKRDRPAATSIQHTSERSKNRTPTSSITHTSSAPPGGPPNRHQHLDPGTPESDKDQCIEHLKLSLPDTRLFRILRSLQDETGYLLDLPSIVLDINAADSIDTIIDILESLGQEIEGLDQLSARQARQLRQACEEALDFACDVKSMHETNTSTKARDLIQQLYSERWSVGDLNSVDGVINIGRTEAILQVFEKHDLTHLIPDGTAGIRYLDSIQINDHTTWPEELQDKYMNDTGPHVGAFIADITLTYKNIYKRRLLHQLGASHPAFSRDSQDPGFMTNLESRINRETARLRATTAEEAGAYWELVTEDTNFFGGLGELVAISNYLEVIREDLTSRVDAAIFQASGVSREEYVTQLLRESVSISPSKTGDHRVSHQGYWSG